jgi:cysteine desulfurase
MSETLYFDHAASAPRRPEVATAMAPWQTGVVGNPSGSHKAARLARTAVEESRDIVAEFLGAKPGDVIFTAGGTESCHLAIVGVTNAHRRTHEQTNIVISPVEHHAVIAAAEQVASQFSDVELRYVDVDADGVVEIDSLWKNVSPNTALVSVMTANNETGVCQPLDAVSAVAKGGVPGGAITHTDAVAAAPWLDLSVVTSTIDLISICGHKLGGPVNVGALVSRGPVSLEAVVPGGEQERGKRGGTVDVAAVVGLAAAIRATAAERIETYDRVTEFQTRLSFALSLLPGVAVTAKGASLLPGHVHVTVDGLASDEMLFMLDQNGVCASAASSCSSGAAVASHVLAAMDVPASRAKGALRFTMGSETTEHEVAELIRIFSGVVHQLRGDA